MNVCFWHKTDAQYFKAAEIELQAITLTTTLSTFFLFSMYQQMQQQVYRA